MTGCGTQVDTVLNKVASSCHVVAYPCWLAHKAPSKHCVVWHLGHACVCVPGPNPPRTGQPAPGHNAEEVLVGAPASASQQAVLVARGDTNKFHNPCLLACLRAVAVTCRYSRGAVGARHARHRCVLSAPPGQDVALTLHQRAARVRGHVVRTRVVVPFNILVPNLWPAGAPSTHSRRVRRWWCATANAWTGGVTIYQYTQHPGALRLAT